MLATYTVLYVLIPKFLLRQKAILFAMLFVGISSLSIVLQRLTTKIIFVDILKTQSFSFLQMFLGTTIFLVGFEMFLLISIASAIKLFKIWYQTQKHKIELEKQNVENELALLRTQINPHFLFNTLNNINSLIYINQDSASETVIKLSEIMRYMLYDSNTNTVRLENEIELLRNYIDLQKIRIDVINFVEFTVEGTTNGILIPPMLLITFVENAFKHCKKDVATPGIIVKISISNNSIIFESRNFVRAEKSRFTGSGGFGIKNICRRLDLIYKQNYSLNISEADGKYQVKLVLSINNG